MRYFPHYSAPPRQPFRLPISSHPPAAPCGPGRTLAGGAFVSRGGVFEGPAMSRGDEHCGYWSDHIGEVALWNQGFYPAQRPAPPYHTRVVNSWPPETRGHFQPRSIMLGFPAASYAHPAPMHLRPLSGVQSLDPMALNVNRSRRVWTGPQSAQQDWPDMMTPRGGVLDGNTLGVAGQGAYQAFYDSASPPVMMPPPKVDVLPNPRSFSQRVPSVGWGVPGTPKSMELAGMGEYYSAVGAGGVRNLPPAAMRAGYGAQEATKGAPVVRGDQSDSASRAVCPKAVSSSIFGGRVPGGPTIGRSIFSMPVYENGGNVPERMTVTPMDLAVSATNAEAAVQPACGAGPDGIGASPMEWGRTARGRRARVKARLRMRRALRGFGS